MQDIQYVGEHLLPGQVGQAAIVASFVASLFAAVSYFFATQRRDADEYEAWRGMGRWGFLVHGLSVFTIIGIMFYLMVNQYYEYQYVQAHVSEDLPFKYIFSAFWEGQEGSFLLWMFWHVILGLVLMALSTSGLAFTGSAGLLLGMAQSGTTYAVIYGVIARQVAPEKRSWAMGVAAAAGSFGQFLMVPVESWLISAWGWQSALIILGCVALAIMPLAFGLKGGLTNESMLEVITQSVVASPLIGYKKNTIISGDYTPAATLDMLKKDVDLFLSSGEDLGMPLPIGEKVKQLYEAAASRGLGGKDFFVLVQDAARMSSSPAT